MTTTSSTSAAAHGTTQASQTQGSNASARGHGRAATGTQGNSDLFANLLLLLNASSELSPDTLGNTLETPSDANAQADGATALAQDSTQNPLAGLLGWPGTALPLMPSTAGATAEPAATGPSSLQADAAGLHARNGTAPTVDALSKSLASAQPADGLMPATAPETLDPDTLAALARANTPVEALPADAQRGAAAVRITAWRSTTGLAPSAAGQSAAQALSSGSPAHASMSHAAFAQATMARNSGTDAISALAPQMRSTVLLDERFAQASADSESASPLALGSSSGAGARSEALPAPTGAGGAGADTGQDAPSDLSQGFSTASDNPDASEAAAQAAAEADDSASWGVQHLRHASVRLGEPGEQAIDIQLSMAGQEVRVEFRTDDAQTRASLAQDGGAALGELLQRSGIDLGGVSVGAQAQQHGQDQPARTPPGQTAQAAQRNREAEAATPASAVQPARPRADGSRPLDLFV